MLGISYGELFFLMGVTAALIGPKDLPKIARMAGRFSGRAIGYVQMARGHLDSVMQQSQASQVHKELQDALTQLEAIRYEVRSLSLMNHGRSAQRLTDETKTTISTNVTETVEKDDEKLQATTTSEVSEEFKSNNSSFTNIHNEAVAYAKLAESPSIKSAFSTVGGEKEKPEGDLILNILPISAQSAGLLPKQNDDAKGSDILLEAILESETAHHAKHFFAQPENQIKSQ
ncbi:hypothetical protein ZOSMA_14G01190 [Zostera marina]|uniref:Sec-independent protein translocase protein TatB n=1 Tax=Zostera marina TaxID=29655 RepID=A0A0K9PYP1_ZOSMR|nr:hypothetical protein ZOSMA_14G01190 [Zostera marina]